ncbi:MAG: glycosyltransferase family 9 protein [Ignavibacteriales bacterium]|nr:glycosyltransferase family 9 protein [Ignavibacteriales bacterium]
MTIFDHVHVFPRTDSRSSRLVHALKWGSTIRKHRYDVVIDLQRNLVSRMIRRAAQPQAWGEFDRFSAKAAGDRVLETFHGTGFPQIEPLYQIKLQGALLARARQLLEENGWDAKTALVVLNPAGLFASRNWPIQNYAYLGKLWREREEVKFVLLGTDRIREKAELLQREFDGGMINLTGRTTLAEALGILQFVKIIISEDSGLMHMAWVSGVPTLALFGSTRHEWSQPVGAHTLLLHSGDLPCGGCMDSQCRYGDVHCLTRYTPEFVLQKARELSMPARHHETPFL